MTPTVRYDEELGRFVLNVAKDDPLMFDVRRLEGRRWDKKLRAWTTPPSLRAWKQLQALAFTMLRHGGGQSYVDWLGLGAHVNGVHNDTLFEHQVDGIAWLARRRRAGLFDVMGLGKTYTAIGWGDLSPRPKLVIAPKIALRGWSTALVERLGAVPITMQGKIVVPMTEESRSWWHLVNYEYLPKQQVFSPGTYDLLVDEAHLATNTKARRTKLTMALATSAARVLLITGTPPAQPKRLWPFFVMLGEREPKEFFPYMLRYAGAYRHEYGWDFDGAIHLDELADEMKHFAIRRTKELVHLPEKLYTTVYAIDLTKQVIKNLDVLDTEILEMVAKGHSMGGKAGVGAMQQLRVLASEAKVTSTVQWVANHFPAKQIIFCEFRSSMDAIASGLEQTWQAQENNTIVLQINGDTKDPKDVEQRFWNEPNVGAVVCQYEAAGHAINLQCSSTVVIHDLPWTPDQLDQAIDRAHRIGQRDSVHVVTMLSGSRVEGLMLQGLRDHRQLSDALYKGIALPPPQFVGRT